MRNMHSAECRDIATVFKQRLEERKAKVAQANLESLRTALGVLDQNDQVESAYFEVSRLYCSLGRSGEEIAALEKGIALCPPSARLYRSAIHTLHELNRMGEAIGLAREAATKFPDQLYFKFLEHLSLPILYSDSAEIGRYRQRFSDGLDQIARSVKLETPAGRREAFDALGRHVNFLLAYQGQDDCELQRSYGQLVHQIMAANYPQWVAPLPMPPDEGKLRIGFLSAFFQAHSVSKSHLGWLREHDNRRFQVFAYHIGSKTDAFTDEARHSSDVFLHLTDKFEDVCRVIRADDLHILVYLDIGMFPPATQLAALRLAPVQAATWGHPITSGLPTVDYFFSSELMEPPEAQNYYTETLVNLPGVGICYRKPVIPRPLFYRTRADFGIREDAVVYLSCQSTFKHLPEQDHAFAELAKRVPNAQFVFIIANDYLEADFRRRLERAFALAGLTSDGRLIFVPFPLDWPAYLNLNSVSDVYLDTFEWSGCTTTFEAIACRLPMVTLPGRFLRGRHTFAILKQMEVTETIARDRAHYVEIAARLGRDPEWRKSLVQRMIAAYPRLYEDQRSVRALEAAFEAIVRERRSRRM